MQPFQMTQLFNQLVNSLIPRVSLFPSRKKRYPENEEARPVKKSVKDFCVKLAQKYLTENAVHFYQSLRVIDEDSDTE